MIYNKYTKERISNDGTRRTGISIKPKSSNAKGILIIKYN